MTQQSTNKAYYNFVRGIITEAGPLTFPEDAALDIENCVLNRDGSIQRRLGMDFESDAVLRNVTIAPTATVACFLWENAANDVNNQFAVVQAGNQLLVFDARAVSASANLLATIDISPYISVNGTLSAASGLGFLFLDFGTALPAYLAYNPSSGAITITQYGMQVRDVWGLDDGLAVDTTPGSLSVNHHYNLLNQGWNDTNINAYFASQGVYPSNAQQWFLGKDSSDNFDPALLAKQFFGTTPAPKGRYIVGAFDRSVWRDSHTGLVTPVDTDTGRPSVVAFAFERLFHAGVKSTVTEPSATRPNMTGFVFYSRTLRDLRDISQYHPDADPTSEIDSELVDTDGGFVNIPNSGPIHKLLHKDNAIVIFAENGIWLLQGDEGGFRATSNQVVKVSEFGVISGSTVVDIEEAVLYWNKGGIYLLGIDPDTGKLKSTSITETTIQTLFNSWSKNTKTYSVGTFDAENRRVMWLYNDETDYGLGSSFRNRYNKELVFDLVLKAFYKHSITTHDEPSPYVAGYLATPDFLLRQEGIVSASDTVTKYLTVQFLDPATNAGAVTFSYYRDQHFNDWSSLDGTGNSFLSYILTGYEIMGDGSRSKQSTYVTTHFKFTETEAQYGDPLFPFEPSDELFPVNPSACVMQAQWDWANHPDSGKWGQEIFVYRLLRAWTATGEGPVNYGQRVITNKNRVPGSGKALSLYFRSEDNKDFRLIGWTTRFTGASNV